MEKEQFARRMSQLRLKRLNQSLRRLTGHQLELLVLLVQEMK